jgi:PAS domain S-box-containing protein
MAERRKRSLRRRLIGIIMVTSTTAVLLTCLGYIVSGLLNFRMRLERDVSTMAQVIGDNSATALAFGDHKGARQILGALRAKPSIAAAGIYTKEGKPFAAYGAVAVTSLPAIASDGFHDRNQSIEVFHPILLDGVRIGTLYMASDASDRNTRLVQYLKISAQIILGSLLVAFLLSARLSRQQARLEETVELRTQELTLANAELLAAKNDAERAAEENAKLARESALILNSATDGIFGVGLDGEPSFLNPAGVRMLGRTLEELRGTSIHDLIHHSRADGTPLPAEGCPLGQAVHRGDPLTVSDDIFWRADGTSFPVEYSIRPMFDDDGRKLGAVVMFRDVTERRAIERMKSEFVSTVSHELRTPLTSIRGALGLLSSGLLGTIAEKAQRMLEIAVGNTDRLVRLINDILDLERIESGTVELTHGQVDAAGLMRHAVEGLHSIADAAGVLLVAEPVQATLWGDSDRIIQTLTNLLGNAIKFSPAGTTVTVSAAATEGELTFCIADQGRGVPPQKLEAIFERFHQVNASDSRDKGGSGLGLAICRSIVHAHGGRIWAETNEPRGSRFLFTIPLAAPASTLAAPALLAPAAGEPSASSVRSIVIVEDDLDLARVLTAALQRRGNRILHASRGREAIDLCRQHPPSLIVLDVTLPDIDGFMVVEALRKSPSLREIPLLVYSALDVGSADRLRLTLGPTEFLTKSRCSPAEFEENAVRLLATVAA